MQPFWEIVASNALLVVVLAAGVALLGRVWKDPLCLHLLWVLVLLKLVTPPVVTIPIALPASHTTGASEEGATSQHGRKQSRVDGAGHEPASIAAGREHQPLAMDWAASDGATSHLGEAASVAQRQRTPWLAVLGWTWGAGIVLFAFGHARRVLRFKRLFHSSEAPSFGVLSTAEGIGKRLGLRRVPEIRMLPVCVSPLVWSLGGRPRVFLPAALFERLDGAAQEAILAHELAHVRRKDHWVRLLEVVITTLFWWHPVVWWAARRLQELEDQCCDAMVVDLAPDAAKSYATALLDTLDFLCDRPVPAPPGLAAARSSVSLRRRIAMLNSRSWTARLTFGRVMLLLTVAALPMALAFGATPPGAKEQPQSEATSGNTRKQEREPPVQRRAVSKFVADFPEKTDLSTPESALAAFHRVIASPDPRACLDLSPWKYTPRDVADIRRKMELYKDSLAKMREGYRNAEIIEVLTYRGDLAQVISKLKAGEGDRRPYSARAFVRVDGVWKNFGENRLATLEEARKDFERIKDNLWAGYREVLDGIAKGEPVRLKAGDLSSSQPKRSAPIAPGEPRGISVEKADLMGRVEWAMMHGARDITARKTIEWGDVEKDADGNRKIRYKFYATIWDKDVYIMNNVFTFDAKGNILDMEDVEGFPEKKAEKPVNVSTQEGMKELVEDFFSKNFRDVTSRESIEWGEVTKAENGNASIRYKYRAKIWDKDTKIMNQVFTFDPKGKYVSFKNVEGFPQNP